MTIRRTHIHQTVGAVVALAIAYGAYFWGVHLLGRFGILVIVLSVPAGVLFGWLTIKLFEFADRMVE